MTIGKEMGLCLGGMIAACAMVGAAGWWSVSALAERLDESIAVSARQIELAGDLKVAVFTFRLQERGMLLFSHIQAQQQVAASGNAYDKAMSASFEKIRLIRSPKQPSGTTKRINWKYAGCWRPAKSPKLPSGIEKHWWWREAGSSPPWTSTANCCIRSTLNRTTKQRA
jgi:hypothetical protein